MGNRYRVSNPNHNLDKKISVISLLPGDLGELRGKHDAALPQDGEPVSVKVIFRKKKVEGRGRVELIVHGLLEREIRSGEAAQRAVNLYGRIQDWIRDKADPLGKEYATDGSPQTRYLMRE